MTPEVITGYKGPRGEHRAPGEVRGGQGLTAIPEGKTVFQFKKAKYRLQLTAPEEIKRSDGTTRRDRALVAVASDYFLMLDNTKDKDKIERILDHPDFKGNGGADDFWDFRDKLAEIQKGKEDEVLRVLENPESRARIIAALQASEGGFQLPSQTGKGDARESAQKAAEAAKAKAAEAASKPVE